MSNEIVRVDVSQYAIMNGPGASIVRENLAGDQITAGDLPRIKTPTSGGKNWELPSGPAVPEFEGIIVYSALQKAYWEGTEPTPGTPPSCFGSLDRHTGMWHGVGDPGGDCSQCAFNVFGSEIKAGGVEGKGKACGDKRIVLIALPGSVLPTVLYVPATSLKGFKKYLLGLDAPYKHVVTRFGLEQDKNSAGIVYSRVVPEKAGNIPAESIPMVDSMIDSMSILFRQIMSAPAAPVE